MQRWQNSSDPAAVHALGKFRCYPVALYTSWDPAAVLRIFSATQHLHCRSLSFIQEMEKTDCRTVRWVLHTYLYPSSLRGYKGLPACPCSLSPSTNSICLSCLILSAWLWFLCRCSFFSLWDCETGTIKASPMGKALLSALGVRSARALGLQTWFSFGKQHLAAT